MLTNAGTATPTTLRLRLHCVGAHAAGVKGLGSGGHWRGAKPVKRCSASPENNLQSGIGFGG